MAQEARKHSKASPFPGLDLAVCSFDEKGTYSSCASHFTDPFETTHAEITEESIITNKIPMQIQSKPHHSTNTSNTHSSRNKQPRKLPQLLMIQHKDPPMHQIHTRGFDSTASSRKHILDLDD